MWSAASLTRHNPPSDFLWKEQHKWGTGPECTTILCKPNGQVSLHFLYCGHRLHCCKLFYYPLRQWNSKYIFFKFRRLWRGQLRLIHLASRTKFPRGTQDRLPYQRLWSLLRRRHFLVLQGMHQRILISLHNIHNYRKSRQISPALEFSVSCGNCVCFFLKCGYQLVDIFNCYMSDPWKGVGSPIFFLV